METTIMNYYNIIKNKIVTPTIPQQLYIILILNYIDGILTYIGIKYQYAIEMNPVTNLFIGNMWYMILLKLMLPTVLIMLALWRIKQTGVSNIRLSTIVVNIGLWLYVFITLNHVYVLIQLLISEM